MFVPFNDDYLHETQILCFATQNSVTYTYNTNRTDSISQIQSHDTKYVLRVNRPLTSKITHSQCYVYAPNCRLVGMYTFWNVFNKVGPELFKNVFVFPVAIFKNASPVPDVSMVESFRKFFHCSPFPNNSSTFFSCKTLTKKHSWYFPVLACNSIVWGLLQHLNKINNG
jgi:hypothetical protein